MSTADESNPELAIDFARLAPRPGSRLVIIGAFGGIGAALSARAAQCGIEIFALDVATAMAGRDAPAGTRPLPIDVRDEQSIAAAAEAIGAEWDGIDGLVYLSGVGERPTPMTGFSSQMWDRTQEINLRGAFLASKAFAPLMRPGTGSIVYVSSGLAINVEPGFAAYSASKAGLIAMAKVLAKELAPGVRVNVVAPGVVETAFLAGGTASGVSAAPSLDAWFGPAGAQAMRAAIPLNRVAQPDDVVAPILFLLGTGARFMTGQTLHVNGGRYLP